MNKSKILTIFALGLVSMNSPAVTYNQLDDNRDGFISNDEAQEMPELAGQWLVTDSNKDGKIDQSEFALFEIKISHEIAAD